MSWLLIGKKALGFLGRHWKLFVILGLVIAWKGAVGQAEHWEQVARSITLAIGDASDNPDLAVGDAARQVVALGKSRDAWRSASEKQSDAVNRMLESTKQLGAIAAQRRREIEAAVAKRDAAIKRLENQAITPGDRADCAGQLRAAEDVLDGLYDGGF